MVSWHSIGIALGAIAVALAAFLQVDPNPDGDAVNRALAGLAAAFMAASVLLLHYYPTEVSGSPQPPPPSP